MEKGTLPVFVAEMIVAGICFTNTLEEKDVEETYERNLAKYWINTKARWYGFNILFFCMFFVYLYV